MKATDPKAAEITALYSEIASEAFPYEDCRRLLSNVTESAVEHLIPDLDLYLSNVASHAIGIDRVLKWAPDRAAESLTKLSRSFFEMHPQYELLHGLITPEATPLLHRYLRVTEELRHRLLDVLREIAAREPITS